MIIKFEDILIPFLIIFQSCTYSVTLVHTEGTATDVVDETQSNTPNVSPDVNVPITPGI